MSLMWKDFKLKKEERRRKFDNCKILLTPLMWKHFKYKKEEEGKKDLHPVEVQINIFFVVSFSARTELEMKNLCE